MTKNIAWIETKPLYTDAHRLKIEREYPGTKFTFHPTADAALQDLAINHYDLIVVEPVLTAGSNYIFCRDDLRELCYYGIDLIQRVRASEGLNHNTPIIAVYPNPEKDLTQKLQEAGANEVVDYSDCLPSELCEIVKKYLK